MKLIADLHTHTVASTHAFATIDELAREALRLGYKALAITDHGPAMPDAPHRWYFSNMVRLPEYIHGDLMLLKGVEANLLDLEGGVDFDDEMLEKFDWVIASAHGPLLPPAGEDAITNMWLRVAENPLVDMLGHSEQRQYPYDYDRVTKACAATGTVVELNAGSALARPGDESNLRQIALCCKRNGTRVAVTSDAHSTYMLDNKQPVLDMLADIGFPEELVINSSMERLMDTLTQHGRKERG